MERSRLSLSHAKGLSRRTVVAFGVHSSQPHYISSNLSNIEVNDKRLLVVESGAQYYEGTTDVSRTYVFGEASLETRQAYTNVLAGILRLANLKIPADLKPSELDALVRSPVWDTRNDYPESSTHGIGCYNAVEERKWKSGKILFIPILMSFL